MGVVVLVIVLVLVWVFSMIVLFRYFTANENGEQVRSNQGDRDNSCEIAIDCFGGANGGSGVNEGGCGD